MAGAAVGTWWRGGAMFVIAMISSSCWVTSSPSSSPPPPRPPPPPRADEPAPPGHFAVAPQPQPQSQPPTLQQQAGTAPTSCGLDQLFETVCGGVAAPNVAAVCGPRGDSLQSYGDRRVSVTQPTGMANDPQLRHFELDDIASDAYRKKLATRGLGSLGNYCCYSRCTPLVVARSAAKVTTTNKRHVVGERCIPAPAGGTTVPAKGRPECPAAAQLAGATMSPLVRSEPARAMRSGDMWWVADAKATCCYSVIAVREVEWRDGCDTCKCAAEGTLVRTPTGEVAIEQLIAGDVVLSMDGGALRPVPIARVARTAATDHVVIAAQLDDGRTVMMSPLHPTADGRRFADLVIGDALGTARVVGVTRVRYGAAFTYDILPASDSGTYVANGALVGSTLTP